MRFTPDEAATFLRDVMDLALTADNIAALETRTEGWIAGLQLAALALRDRSDTARFVDAFTGSNRFVLDYLADEVLAQQPPYVQRFLLHTAILERLCGSLCDAVLGLDGTGAELSGSETPDRRAGPSAAHHHAASLSAYSQLLLQELERANLFVVPLDDARHWYRYHHLFADVLRHRLSSGVSANDVTTLHQRASQWLEVHGLIAEAMPHALAARDWEHAARLLEEYAAALLTTGQVYTTLGWMAAIPEVVEQAHPLLGVWRAAGLLFTNQLDAVQHCLEQVERSSGPDLPADLQRLLRSMVAILRGNILYLRGDLEAALHLVRQSVAGLPHMMPDAASTIAAAVVRGAAPICLATVYKLTGDVGAASERLVAETTAPIRAVGNLIATLNSYTYLAYLQTLQGRLRAAADTYAQVEQLVPSHDVLRSLACSTSYFFGLGDLLRERNELAAAERYLLRGVELVHGPLAQDGDVIMRGYLALARLHQARGDDAQARAALQAYGEVAQERNLSPLLLAPIQAAWASLQVAHGDLDAAIRWANVSELQLDDAPNFLRESEYLSLARIRIAQGRTVEVLPLLHRLQTDAEAKARTNGLLQVLILQALAQHAHNDTEAARAALERAVALAQPEGYVRVFVDEGPAMHRLLMTCGRWMAHRDSPALLPYVETLLAAFPTPDGVMAREAQPPTSPMLPEPLTQREHDVLRLIANGLSNGEIADRLVVGVSTVKKHINAIFSKLGVHSRTEALAQARQRALL